MEIRELKKEDVGELLVLVNDGMKLDKFTFPLLEENTINDEDYAPELTLLAIDDNKMVGFIMGVIREREDGPMGYVKILCVDPEYRRKKVASELYGKIEIRFMEKGIKKIRVYEAWPNYYMPGIDPFYTEAICFFERNGYKKIGDTSNLKCELTGQDFSTYTEEDNLEAKEIKIIRASKEDYDRVMEWTAKNFAPWKFEITSAFQNDPISLHIAIEKEEMIAFSAYEANNKGTGWFGPMGTTEAARGKGVGGILLKKCLADMKKAGFKKAIIPWVGPIPFYMHYANAKMDRVFWRYEKTL